MVWRRKGENLVGGLGEGPFHKVELRGELANDVVPDNHLLLQGPDVCLALLVAGNCNWAEYCFIKFIFIL
jgi:hypothetical protein